MIRPQCDVCGERSLEVVGEITRPDRLAANWCRNCGTYYADPQTPEGAREPWMGSPTIPRITAAMKPLIAFVNQQVAARFREEAADAAEKIFADVTHKIAVKLSLADDDDEEPTDED